MSNPTEIKKKKYNKNSKTVVKKNNSILNFIREEGMSHKLRHSLVFLKVHFFK